MDTDLLVISKDKRSHTKIKNWHVIVPDRVATAILFTPSFPIHTVEKKLNYLNIPYTLLSKNRILIEFPQDIRSRYYLNKEEMNKGIIEISGHKLVLNYN